MIWQEISGNWVLVPPRPIAIIHFLGGAFVAAAPQVTYRCLLEFLAEEGYAIVATPFVNTFDHTAIARDVLKSFNAALDYLQSQVFKKRYLPIYGVGHSMGCKLHVLIGSLFPQERAGNILISFNNYPARRSIPFFEQFYQFAPNLAVEFTPSPEETNDLIEQQYQVRRNLLIKFTDDDIDQTKSLTEALLNRFPSMTALKILKGNHLTPLGQDVKWQTGNVFTPLDAIGQFVRQEVYRDFNQLKRDMLMWLAPTRF
ncbi:DUF1350 family protein [Oscillatoria sp. FACHB-1407]|uniref:DUF1350 family protein n=1 Tax=Oscillatoria sp. FACHB-1407 TaxID=2692847 RepID=UPI0016879875|nr:DUF1350 family protein [Oscillatoria sp. FACHB-1407]MBD2459822.1 DUF1350 family protein [Oscillatoria sp. FACHB-1407]